MANYQQYAEYKELESIFVEKIPANWSVKPLYTLCGFKQGKAHEPFIDDDGEFICVNARFVSTQGKGGSVKRCNVNLTSAKLNDILMVMSDLPNGRALARAFYVTVPKNNYAVNQRVCVITAREVHAKFLYYQLNRSPYFLMFDDGSNQTHLSNDSYKKYPVILPSTIEQTQIANFLDFETAQIDTLIEKQQTLIQLLKEKRQAVISHAVTKGLNPDVPMKDSGVEWLGEVPEHWEVSPLKYFIKSVKGAVKAGPFGSHLKGTDLEGEDVKVITQKNVIRNNIDIGDAFISFKKYKELKVFTIFEKDILITTRGTIGRTYVYDTNKTAILHPCLIRIQIDENKAEPDLISLIIQESGYALEQILVNSNATTIEVIYSENLINTFITVPDNSNEQIEILNFIRVEKLKFDHLISKAEQAILLMQERRTALISAAVTGKIDVRGWVAPDVDSLE